MLSLKVRTLFSNIEYESKSDQNTKSLLFFISEPLVYFCGICRKKFDSAWSLVQHVQSAHNIRIYFDATSPVSALETATSLVFIGRVLLAFENSNLTCHLFKSC